MTVFFPRFREEAANASFFVFGQRFTSASRRSASPLEGSVSVWMMVTGRRDRVYLAPFPSLCARSRSDASLQMPAYSDPSAHRAR